MKPTLIMTRPERQGTVFVQRLQDQWPGDIHVIQAPLLDILPIDVQLPDVAGLIFTSVNGVAQAKRLGARPEMPAFCVGQKTSDAAATAGFSPRTGPGNAKGLMTKIARERPNGPLAHIRGEHARGAIAQTLTAAGVPCHDVVAYMQTPRQLSDTAATALAGKFPVVLPLFSPRTGTILSEQGPFTAPVHIAAISRAALPDLAAAQAEIAAQPDEDAMIDATIACLQVVTQDAG